MTRKITVLIADDHTILRQGIRSLLEDERDIEVVGEAANGREAVELTLKLHPNIVLMDIGMPVMYGLQATRVIRQKEPRTKVIILTMYSDEDFVSQVVTLGASGYLVKQSAVGELVMAIREVAKGNAFFSPSISRLMAKRISEASSNYLQRHTRYALTSREIEILQLISEGSSNKDICIQLSISIKTVEKHRGSIMEKLDIHDVAGLTRYAFTRGIIHGDPPRKQRNPGS